MTPRPDADTAEAMERLAAADLPAFQDLSPKEARALLARLREAAGVTGPEVASAKDLEVGGVPCRLYKPHDSPPTASAPLILYAHGGGWVVGTLDSHDAICRAVAVRTGAAVLSIGYRLAPEHPFPAALDDIRAVVAAAPGMAMSEEVPGPLVLAGDSAGANLMAVAALMSRDGDLPRIAAQVLLCPALDLTMDTPSHGLNMPGLAVTGATMAWFGGHYAQGRDPADWRLSPARAPGLDGLAPTVLVTAGLDPLCDEGCGFAGRLTAEGCSLAHLHYPGQAHAFMVGNPMTPRAAGCLAAVAAALDGFLAPV